MSNLHPPSTPEIRGRRHFGDNRGMEAAWAIRWGAPAAIVLLAAICPAPANAARPEADFNCDGRSDLAIGVPEEDLAGPTFSAGAIHVVYAKRRRLKPARSVFLTQGDLSTGDGSESGDRFGLTLASGYFNRDRCADLAVGAPFETIGGVGGTGAVSVIYGSRSGLDPDRTSFLNQGLVASDGVDPGDNFGSALAAGDLGRNGGGGRDDLAIGAPGEALGGFPGGAHGAASVVYSKRNGLDPAKSRLYTQAVVGSDGPEANDVFGSTLAIGDFGLNRREDLAIGSPGDSDGAKLSAGAVAVVYSRTPPASQYFTQQQLSGFQADQSGGFGSALASGELGKGRRDDLVIGSPFGVLGGTAGAGSVHVLYGRKRKPLGTGARRTDGLDQGALRGDGVEPGDEFGLAVTTGPLGRGKRDDLVIGVPREDLAAVPGMDHGAVHVIPGGKRGLKLKQNKLLHQGKLAGEGAEADDLFGYALSAGRLGRRRGFLAVAAPHESLGGITAAGALNVVYAGAKGLKRKGNRLLGQGDLPGDGPEAEDMFGCALLARATGQCPPSGGGAG
jgi:hypothetical protein